MNRKDRKSSAVARFCRLTATIGVGLAMSVSAPAAVVFSYQFEDGPDGAAIGTVVDSGPNALVGSGIGVSYTNNVASNGGSFAMNAAGDVNYARVNNNAAMHVQEFSLSALANPTGRGGIGGNPPTASCWLDTMCNLVGKKWGEGGNFLDSYGIYYLQGTGQFRGYIGFGNETGRVLTSANSYAIGSGWHEVVLTLDRDVAGATDRLDLFVDNVLQASLTEELPAIFFNGGDLLMGASNFFANPGGDFRRNFDGLIDSVVLTDLPFQPRTQVPEPGTLALCALSVGLMVALRRFRRQPGRWSECDARQSGAKSWSLERYWSNEGLPDGCETQLVQAGERR